MASLGEQFMIGTMLAATIASAISSLVFVAAAPRVALAVEIKVLSGSGVQPVMIELIPRFEQ
jgi:hypothetical protein